MKIIPNLVLLCGVAALGHDLYLMPATFFPTAPAVTVAFHSGDAFPESEVAGRADRIRDPKLLWKGGSATLTNLRADGKRLISSGNSSASGEIIAAVHTTPTLIELEAPKFTEYLKEEGLTATIDWRNQHGESAKPGKERYSKYAKSILLGGAPDGFASHSVGYIIEIIPQSDPYRLKPGDRLPVQVLFRGKPAADLQIESAWAAKAGKKTTVVGRTGLDGRLDVPLQAAGTWRIHTIKMERCADAAVADWESFWASLTFELR
jgi:hypothetical protein